MKRIVPMTLFFAAACAGADPAPRFTETSTLAGAMTGVESVVSAEQRAAAEAEAKAEAEADGAIDARADADADADANDDEPANGWPHEPDGGARPRAPAPVASRDLEIARYGTVSRDVPCERVRAAACLDVVVPFVVHDELHLRVEMASPDHEGSLRLEELGAAVCQPVVDDDVVVEECTPLVGVLDVDLLRPACGSGACARFHAHLHVDQPATTAGPMLYGDADLVDDEQLTEVASGSGCSGGGPEPGRL